MAERLDIRPDLLRLVQDILQRHVPDREVRAFGSRVKGTARPSSDLDLVVMGDEPLPLPVYAALLDDFEQSDLPWRVDVVDWATTAESFRRIIEQEWVGVQPLREIILSLSYPHKSTWSLFPASGLRQVACPPF